MRLSCHIEMDKDINYSKLDKGNMENIQIYKETLSCGGEENNDK